ncbi:MEMO1 family protein [Pyrofollis japonicus]|uniref:AmmeMemoRadiSam system protein B n=1 Tax=Pyrofollis japonicus TaxID=3060460 RepID=UPI00295BF885|nr:AmmeMemoRadiSam system protein B [Pyrofollis japonicus]BEP18681.1 MEMO1 family protein [Pyrofollis japonicus]
MDNAIRKPYAALIGFYPNDRGELIRAIEKSFLDQRFGPGRLPEPLSRKGECCVIGGVAPHAGYSYSGPCAAHLYLELAETTPRPETVVILGTNHTGYGGFFTTTTRFKKWATPLGDVPVDIEFIEALMDKSSRIVDEYLAHLEEHSVEVELPFLQYVYGDEFSLVPITVKDATPSMARDVARAIHDTARELGRRIVLIASSDFTHHGYMYGYVVFTENVAENVAKLDLSIIEHILRLDTEGFYKRLTETGATVCGYGAIATLMEYAKLVGGVEAQLLRYYNSAQLTGEEDIAVGYAAIAFRKQG